MNTTKLTSHAPSAAMTSSLVTSNQIWLETQNVMSEHVMTIAPDQTLIQAADTMTAEGVSSLVVMDDRGVVGILTEHDFLRAVVKQGGGAGQTRVSCFMTSPVETVSPNRSILDASRIMSSSGIKRLPVVAKGKLVGIITQTDLIRALTHVGTQEDVGDIMSTDVQTICPEATVAEAATIMEREGISCLVGFSDNQPVGMLTERDMLVKVTASGADPNRMQVRDVMAYPVVAVAPTCSVFGAARTMDERHVHRLVVVEDEVLAGIVTQTDIFRAAKKRLQKEETKGYDLLQNTDNCVFMLDSEGVTTYVNPAFLRLFEVNDPSVFQNQPFLPETFWVDPRQRSIWESAWMQSHADIEELELQTARGHCIFVSLAFTFTRDIHGCISGRQGILRDITARKMAEHTTAIAYERLEKANREMKEMQCQIIQNEKLASIGQLAAGVAHEMNTPVGYVMSNLKSLQKYVQQLLKVQTSFEELVKAVDLEASPYLAESVDDVQTTCRQTKIDFIREDLPELFKESLEGLERITGIIQNLRDFSRVDQAENFDEYQINSGIEATLLVVQNELRDGIEVVTDLGDLPAVPCNAGQINQVFLAILINAIEAQQQTTCESNMGRITVRTKANESHVCCEISDAGPGIPQKDLDRIFEPFFTTKPTGKGTGLGLSAAYDVIVNKHKGEFFVDSIIGQGATFTIHLPLSLKRTESTNTC